MSVQSERGVILPLTLILLVVLVALVSAVLAIGVAEPRIAANLRWGTQAYFTAEAGIERAFARFYTDYYNNPNTLPSAFTFTPYLGGGPMFNQVAFSNGTYTVQIVDNNDGDGNTALDSDNTVIVTSTGTGPGGATRQLRALVTTLYRFSDAVDTNKKLTVSGNACVKGTRGSVHSNGDLDINGSSVTIDQDATATGKYTTSGSPTIGGEHGGNTQVHPIPDLQPSQFRDLATIVLKADGTVTDGQGHAITRPPEWNFKGGKTPEWACCSGHNGTNGVVYVETDVHISSSPNSPSDPWRLSLITTGNLQITGNPSIAPYVDPTTHRALDLQFIAGKDITMGGFPNECTSCLAGLIYAREQFNINGNVPIRGVLMALDATDSPGSPVPAGGNKLTGSTCVVLDRDLRLRGANGPLRFVSWSPVPPQP